MEEGRQREGLLGTSESPAVTGHDVVSWLGPPPVSLALASWGHTPKAQVTVLFIPFIGTMKNPAQPREDSALEEDHLPLQLLESH